MNGLKSQFYHSLSWIVWKFFQLVCDKFASVKSSFDRLRYRGKPQENENDCETACKIHRCRTHLQGRPGSTLKHEDSWRIIGSNYDPTNFSLPPQVLREENCMLISMHEKNTIVVLLAKDDGLFLLIARGGKL